MCSSLSYSTLYFPSKNPFFFNHRSNFCFSVKPFGIRSRDTKPPFLLASIAEKNSILELSWSSSDKVDPDEYNGWAIAEVAPKPVKRSLPAFVVTGIGASVAVLLGLLAYFSASSFRFGIRSPFHALHRYPVPVLADKNEIESENLSSGVSFEDSEVPDENFGGVSGTYMETDTSTIKIEERKERIIVPLAADYAQQEAILSLKKLKIIEENARADELCTRRDYGRWLVLTNTLLERSRKHSIMSSAALSGSSITAFDDVRVEDHDFEYIQSLAEAGVVRSKLSDGNSGTDSDKHAKFFPERSISREDLVSWKAKLEYAVMPGISEEISRKNIGFLDVKEISSDSLMEIFVDVLTDEKSILKRVFGQTKRLQPNKPCTKAQAAVALSSGRMKTFIQAEILRLEAENHSRQSELKEIMHELSERGEIKHFWERKIEEERSRGLELEMNYRDTVAALEHEKTFQENALAELVKQKAALDCQNQLLSSLKTEVADMLEKLDLERDNCIVERHGIQDVLHDLQVKFDGLLDKKSILQAEVEAIRKLRSWVEDEASKSQARAKVLEEATRRWKWDS